MSDLFSPRSKTDILAFKTDITCPFIHATPSEKSITPLFIIRHLELDRLPSLSIFLTHFTPIYSLNIILSRSLGNTSFNAWVRFVVFFSEKNINS